MKLKQIADVSFPTRWANFRLLAFEGMHASTMREPSTVQKLRWHWFWAISIAPLQWFAFILNARRGTSSTLCDVTATTSSIWHCA